MGALTTEDRIAHFRRVLAEAMTPFNRLRQRPEHVRLVVDAFYGLKCWCQVSGGRRDGRPLRIEVAEMDKYGAPTHLRCMDCGDTRRLPRSW